MTSRRTLDLLDSILADVSVFTESHVESIVPLDGGLTNSNFLVATESDSLVVRIAGDHGAQIGIDRQRERAALERATAAGIAPEVVAFLPEGHSVTRFVGDATSYTPDEFTSAAMLVRVAKRLRDIHELDPIEGTFDPYAQIRTWLSVLSDRAVLLPTGLAPLLELVNETERARQLHRGSVLCHNDAWAPNFLHSDHLWVIDWEYAGMGDPLFDLACVGFALDEEPRSLFLDAYASGDTTHRRDDLDRMVDVFVAFWTTWALIQTTIATLDVDYAGIAEDLLGYSSIG